ncbi:MAG: PD-(D/E)XK nuclease family protein, partial [Myxococcales bacterium]|nr:PD-(D/E)XK nuclease family protein [Myxococcales bacterium]
DALERALDAYDLAATRAGSGATQIDEDVFVAELRVALERPERRSAPAAAGAVRICSASDLAEEPLELLVVVDALDGRLPRDEADDPLLPEQVAASLAGASLRPSSSRARELGSLALAAAGAREIVVVAPRADASGDPVAPSQLVAWLERAGVEVEEPAAHAARPAAGADVLRRVALESRREGFFLDPSRELDDRVGDLRTATLAPAARAALTLALTTETGGADRPLAVTALERFAVCRFAGWASAVLRSRDDDDGVDVPDAREEGLLVHAALEAAFTATRELWQSPDRDEALLVDAAVAAAQAAVERHAGHAVLRALVASRVLDAVAAVVRAAVAEPFWVFDLAEQAFGGPPRAIAAGAGEPWSPLVITDAGATVALRGTIDRVDRSRDGAHARVVDYKRGRATAQRSTKSVGDEALQVPLYALAVSERLGVEACGVYLPTTPKDLRAYLRNADDGSKVAELVARPDGALAPIARRVLALVDEVRRGLVAPLPTHEGACRTCSLHGACRKPRFAMTPDDDDGGRGAGGDLV